MRLKSTSYILSLCIYSSFLTVSMCFLCFSFCFLLPLHPLLHLSLLSIYLISESWQYSSWVYSATEGQCFFPCAIYNQEHTFKHDLGKCVKLFNSWQKRSESHFWHHVENEILTAETCPELNNFPLSAWRDISMEPEVWPQAKAVAQCESSAVIVVIPHRVAGGQLKWL